MENLTILKANAIKAFTGADKAGKKLLSDLFGDKVLSEKITDRVKSFEDACELNGENAELLLRTWKANGDEPHEIAYKMQTRIAKALQQGWQADYSNGKQPKWYPWFVWDKVASGFRFSYSYYGCDRTYTAVGPRLCFPTEELADYFGKQFIEIHNQRLL